MKLELDLEITGVTPEEKEKLEGTLKYLVDVDLVQDVIAWEIESMLQSRLRIDGRVRANIRMKDGLG